MPRLLTDEEINKRLEKLQGWSKESNFIVREVEFKDFVSAIRFVNKLARLAEQEEHHPDIYIRYNKVKLMLQTHSEKGVTSWDIQLARKINSLLSQSPERRKK